MKHELMRRHIFLLVALALVALTVVVYWQTLSHSFIGYDDEQYVTSNAQVQSGLTWAGVRWAFTTSHASNWHPLTWISHMLDCQFFGLSPVGPHAVNLLLHIINTLLLFTVLKRMTKCLWKSAFVAAVFALHPMHVESVAWVAERKDVLSTLFWLLTMWAYTRYSECPSLKRYGSVVLFFGLGLLAKPTLVSLPLMLVLLDFWPLGRFADAKARGMNVRSLLLEKVPLLIMAVVSSAATYWAQKAGGAVVLTEHVPLSMRMDNAVLSYAKYIGQLFWPHDLAIFYPHPGNGIPEWQIAGSVVLLLCTTVIALGMARKHPYLTVGWFWYLITLIPMIGLVQVGKAAMADRYSYISYIGLSIMLAWGIGGAKPSGSGTSRTLLTVSALVPVVLMSISTRAQVRVWQNEMTVFQHALNVTSRNDVSHIHVGNQLFKEGRTAQALRHYTEALRINPYSDTIHNNLGNAYARMGNRRAAVREYNAALALKPNAMAHFNLGIQCANAKQMDDAIAHYQKAIEIRPDFPDAHANLAVILESQGKMDEAREHFAEVVRLAPHSADASYKYGVFLSSRGDLDEAISQYLRAIQISPDYAEAHYNLGNAYARTGKMDEAEREYTQAIRIKPDYADAHFNLGVVYDGKQDAAQAMKEYELAIKSKPDHVEAHANLAIDLYISGRYRESWGEVAEAEKYGCKVNPDFLKALSSKMRRPVR